MLKVPDWELQLRGEVLSHEALPSLMPAWQSLCTRAVEDNVYYAPRYARALLDNLENDSRLQFAVIWQHDALVALLPFRRAVFEIPLLGIASHAWQTEYTFSCTPLLDRGCAVEAAMALLAVLGTINEGEWIIPALNTQGAACLAMIEALEKGGWPWNFANTFQRAMLDASGSFEEHMRDFVTAKRRRDLARNRRRLEQIGKVAHESFCDGEGLSRAVEAFLAVEAGGWKGKHGTALACCPQTKRFALQAFTGGAADSICRADVLTLDGAPIAVSLTVFAGSTGFTVKCAYDETYRKYSAGLLLEVEVLRSFLSGRWASRLDAGTAGAHVIDSLWSGRIKMADLLFTLAPRAARWRLSALTQAAYAKQTTRSAVKLFAARLTAA